LGASLNLCGRAAGARMEMIRGRDGYRAKKYVVKLSMEERERLEAVIRRN
jgi:hypothetical protein